MEKQVITLKTSRRVAERTKQSKDGESDLNETSHDRR